MERYTYFDGGKWRLKIGDTEYSGDWVDLLAAYEETGLEPEEIERILDSYGRGMTLRTENAQRLEIIKEIPIDRLRELAQAEKEGRLRIVGVPKGACCGTCRHFEREAGTAHGACKPEMHNWVAQSRTACKAHYAPNSEAALEAQRGENNA